VVEGQDNDPVDAGDPEVKMRAARSSGAIFAAAYLSLPEAWSALPVSSRDAKESKVTPAGDAAARQVMTHSLLFSEIRPTLVPGPAPMASSALPRLPVCS
jgi:hypothetical protein